MGEKKTLTLAMALLLVSAAYASGADWRPVDQPDLAAKIEAAPELKFQELADGPDACWEGPMWWVPNPDGKTWDMIFIYYPTYVGPNQVIIYDAATKELKKSACPEISSMEFGFHMNLFYMIKGKAYISSGNGPSCLFIYDPAVNEFKFGGYPLGREGDQPIHGRESLITINDDGTLIGGFGPLVSKRKQAAFYTIDPVTLKGDFLGEIGPENPNYAWEYRGVIMDGDWIYARIGTTPWRLYGMNVKTRQGKILAETERIIGDRSTITFRTNPDYQGVYVTITGLKGGPKDKTLAFWLRDGQLTPCDLQDLRAGNVKPVPPGGEGKRARPRRFFVGHHTETGLPNGLEVYRGPVGLDSKVRCWYRFTDEAMAQAAHVKAGEWQKIEFSVQFTPQPIRQMVPMPDGSLFTLTEGYGRAVSFDPKTGQRKPIGQTMSVYSACPFEGKLYLSGYPGAQVWIYDPTKPWTAGQAYDGPTPPEERTANNKSGVATPNTNPAHVTMLKEFTDVHVPWAYAVGADGRIYFGGKVVRIGNGGGLGWWDVRENKAGGFHEPFDNYTIFWMCSAAQGRYIVCSTKPVASAKNPDFKPARGRLFVYDTTTREIVHAFEDERLSAFPGLVTEAQPGVVMGCTPTPEGSLLYGFDPAAGKLLWTKPLPCAPNTSFSFIRRSKSFFGSGPDGFVWASMNDVLVRINPQTAEVLPVGKMEQNPIAFAEGDVYVAGSQKFRKIVGIPKVTGAK